MQTNMASLQDGKENIQLTRDEVEKLSSALKDEKFRSLLAEYAEEITDPKNRALYEKEIAELEKERGVEVTFINPEPCYVLKTIVDGEKKAFLNICSNNNVNEATCQRAVEENATHGFRWSIPYSLAPPKEDLDKARQRCVVYDVVFHPDTLYMGKRNLRFKRLIEDTAMEGIEKNFKVTLDRKNVKYPKMKFKGVAVGTVIRKVGSEGLKPVKPLTDTYSIPYPEMKNSNKSQNFNSPVNSKIRDNNNKENITNKNEAVTTPNYVIKHRKHFDLEDYAYDKFGCPPVKNNVPSELNIEIDLPLVHSASQIDLDVNEKTLRLKSENPARYYLDIDLLYHVDSDKSNAKFDVSTHKLCVILPVKTQNYATNGREESCDNNTESENAVNDNSEQFNRVHTSVNDKLTSNISDDNLCTENISDSLNKNEDVLLLSPKPKIAYLLPSYDLRQCDNKLIFVLHVSNVDPDSVDKVFSENGQHCTVSFITLGSGFVPFYYKIFVKAFEEKRFEAGVISVDIEEKNVVLVVNKNDNSEWQSVYVGLDEESLDEYKLLTMDSVTEKMKSLQTKFDEYSKDAENFDKPKVNVNCITEELLEIEIQYDDQEKCSSAVKTNQQIADVSSESEVLIEETLQQQQMEKDERKSLEIKQENSSMIGENVTSNSENASPAKITNISKQWTISESIEDLNHSPSQKPRGILKLRKYSRSISESSDDINFSSQEIITSPDSHIPEESSADESGFRVKKNVRFNEIVSRNLFRSNSSILGQRKKNQRKQRTKKRAAHRRMSESEGSETENEHSSLINQSTKTQSSDDDASTNHEKGETKLDNQQKATDLQKQEINDNQEKKINSCDNDSINGNLEDEPLNHDQSIDNKGDTNDVLNESHSSNDENANKESSSIENNLTALEVNTNKSKTKKKRRRKTKQESDSFEPRTMLSWEDENNGENKKEYKCPIDFANSMIFELD